MRHLLALLVCAAFMLAPAPAHAQRLTRGGERPLPWFGVRIGGLVAASTPAADTPTAAGGGAYALFDGRDFLAEGAVDFYGGSHAQFFAGGLGIYYPFMPQNISPYAGGGLKLGWTKFGGDGTFGLIPYLAGGLLFGREGYIQVRAELAWFFTASGEESKADRPGQTWHPSGPMLTLGMAF
jgi:hypothetical protein